MRKLFLLVLCVAVFATLAIAQNPTYDPNANSTGGLHGVDVLGAHQNGGRGCAGCHAPHSGGQGGGGNAGTNTTAPGFNDPTSGDNALFGQDLTPLYNQTFAFGGGEFSETLPANSDTTTNEEELRSIAMCLACHDGNLAKGGMMVGTSYEKRLGLLPANVYGPKDIPTLLGNEGNGAGTGNYKNDHPVGIQANLGAARLTRYLTITMANGAISSVTPTGAYVNFVANYGAPAIAGTPWSWGVANPEGNNTPGNLFLTCTTCHNQHSMYIYQPPTGTKAPLGANVGGVPLTGPLPTYFFINAPYNPGSLVNDNSGTRASSATQFCRQCHFGEANESMGVNNVTTAY